MKKLFLLFLILCTIACKDHPDTDNSAQRLNLLAEKYIRLGLTIGQYDADFVDAYYGPDSLKPTGLPKANFPKDSLLRQVNGLIGQLIEFNSTVTNDTLAKRAKWMNSQLIAFGRRINIYSGKYQSFDQESKDLFGVVAPSYPESHYQQLLARLDSLLPGSGSVTSRFEKLASQFVIPKAKVDTVFKTAIAEARKRTLAHYELPANEHFTIEYVTGKPWSGYNWYQGNYQSKIQISIDMPIFIERAIDLACHEGYPGHHVYNMLLEKSLYKNKHQVEIALYPLFSPQSLIAEGSAYYGIEVAFPGSEKNKFLKEVLLPLAGLKTENTDLYMEALALKSRLAYARNEVARGIVDGTFNLAEQTKWLKTYGLREENLSKKDVAFINKYRSYVINYNYGQDIVKTYIESKGGTADNPAKRWEVFRWLLSNQVRPADLIDTKK
ncbi:hypothetical protein [Emticicia sp. TH156]|uniref:hypothetical protein n=1 Tax=Emticicia sp. TH156 TaxID=2067454 RepID=UPI000C774E45|nr:hypothetical protein [Emticicia sp. TH156]PLK42280.1 hypothetical protein C0V77_21950 [Emticicia sp. TH156]